LTVLEWTWQVLEPVDAVYGLSDLHADAAQNMNLLLRMEAQPNSALVIAGDAATDFAVFEKLLTMLVSKFKHVCYVVGNHELWSNPRRTAARPMWDGDWMKVAQPRDCTPPSTPRGTPPPRATPTSPS
jgi:calcineurin-like phosphoesterase family protein